MRTANSSGGGDDCVHDVNITLIIGTITIIYWLPEDRNIVMFGG
jgi:hypothetical protein